jgi:phosphatidylinositol glycan class C protein
MTPPTSSLSPLPPPFPVDTHPYRTSGSNAPEQERIPDPNRLAPEDAYFATSLSRIRSAPVNYDDSLRSLSSDGPVSTLRPPRGVLGGDPSRKDVRKLGAGRRRRKGAWKKLLWVKQSCMSGCCGFYEVVLTERARSGQLHRYRDLS